MGVDFEAFQASGMKLGDFARTLTLDQLKDETHSCIDWMLALVADMSDAEVTFDPVDEKANDPHATEGDENIGWNMAHLIAHVTASSEEGAAFCSILGRGVEGLEGRLRYEPDWRTITTQAQCIQRLEESRKMRLAYLDALPEEINLDLCRSIPAGFEERVGKLNAFGCYLLGLSHERGHFAQMEEVKAQAQS